MRVYGNIMNRIEETVRPQIPTVGMGITVLMFSDRHPGTVIEVSKDGETIKFQEDNAKRVDSNGMSESQQYVYSPDTSAKIQVATKRKNGTFVLQGETMKGGTIVRVGSREKYYDFGF